MGPPASELMDPLSLSAATALAPIWHWGCALRLRDEGSLAPVAIGLMFGCYDPTMAGESVARFGGGEYGLSRRDMQWYWKQYLGV
jgi:hypothetical protein